MMTATPLLRNAGMTKISKEGGGDVCREQVVETEVKGKGL